MSDKTIDNKTSDTSTNTSTNTSIVQLLPCPFCGGEATFSNGMDNVAARIRCTKCRCKMEVFGESAFERAREEWNTRKPSERIVERLEEKLSIARQTSYGNEISLGIASGLNLAIEIVKEEM